MNDTTLVKNKICRPYPFTVERFDRGASTEVEFRRSRIHGYEEYQPEAAWRTVD